MFSRDLAIVLRAPAFWLGTTLAALLIGHGFVLAVELYSAGSRSVADNLLMARELDPLLGIVRPTLGGVNLALSLFGPLISARALAIEKDRRTFFSVLLASDSVLRLVVFKWLAAVVGALVPLTAVGVSMAVWCACGGHLDPAETMLAVLGQLLFAALACALGCAAAAFCSSFAQAATAALGCVAASWALDAAQGFTPLAWLGDAMAWSPSSYLVTFERGTLQLSCVSWFGAATAGLLALAAVGCRFDLSWRKKSLYVTSAISALVAACLFAQHVPGAWDVSEAQRHSLPPSAATSLHALQGKLRMTVWLDREDSRRVAFERDALAKLRLARPDMEVRFPLDDQDAIALADHEDNYGSLIVQLNNRSKQTLSTSRRELTTLIFELAERPLPDWTQPEYRGYPRVIEGVTRQVLLAVSYLLTPLALLGTAIMLAIAGRMR